MRSLFFILATFCCAFQLPCIENLKDQYLISYGDSQCSIKVVHYFSFMCPHCIALFQDEFDSIKSQYLDTKQVFWVFHPVPTDLLTVQAMDCLEKLTNKEKQIFLEAILEETALDDPNLSAHMMRKAMEFFGKPVPDLQEKDYLGNTAAFRDAFVFVTQKEKISAVPTVEINGELFLKDVPDKAFIEEKLKERGLSI